MTIIDRRIPRHRASRAATVTSTNRPAAPAPLGGRYVSVAPGQPRIEGAYVSTGTHAVPAARGTYVSTSSRSSRTGGRYTYTG